MSRSKRDTDKGAASGGAKPRKPSLDELDKLDARPFARKRLLDASRDPGQWSGTGENDTIAETSVDAGLPGGLPAELPVELHDELHDSDFTDEDTFTDRDTEADATGLTGLPAGLAGSLSNSASNAGRDTMMELTPRDTLLDLSAAARAASASADHGDRTLENDALPGDDTLDEPTGR